MLRKTSNAKYNDIVKPNLGTLDWYFINLLKFHLFLTYDNFSFVYVYLFYVQIKDLLLNLYLSERLISKFNITECENNGIAFDLLDNTFMWQRVSTIVFENILHKVWFDVAKYPENEVRNPAIDGHIFNGNFIRNFNL